MTSASLSVRALLIVLAVSLAGCGFTLRRSYELPFKTIHVSANGPSVVAANIRRELTETQTKVVPTSAESEAELMIVTERRDRQILSLLGSGRVQEYELRFRVEYRAVRKDGTVLIPTTELLLKRILPYDDSRIIAKAQEEALMYSDMEQDAVGQILRRLIAVSRRTS